MTALATSHRPDPVISAQAAFRAIMTAMARPGTVQTLQGVAGAPEPLSPGAAAFALTILDHETPVWLDATLSSAPAVLDWLRFQTGAPIAADPARAAFAIIGDATSLPPLDTFDPATAEYPDRAATIVLQVDSFDRGSTIALTGPGIRYRQLFRASPCPADMPARLAANRELFPRGVDLVLISQNAVAALPRSVRVVPEDA